MELNCRNGLLMSLRVRTLIKICLPFLRCIFRRRATAFQTEQLTYVELTCAYLQRVHAQNMVYTEMHFESSGADEQGDSVRKPSTAAIRRAQEMAQD